LADDARQAEPFIYQQVAERANVLRRLGMSASLIARRLGVSDKTVTKGTPAT
jgi:transposase